MIDEGKKTPIRRQTYRSRERIPGVDDDFSGALPGQAPEVGRADVPDPERITRLTDGLGDRAMGVFN